MNSASSSIFSKLIPFFIGALIAALFVAGLCIFLQKDDKEKSKNQSINTLEVLSPSDNLATNQKNFVVQGVTKPNSTVTISLEQKNTAIYTTDGKFSANIELVEGQNTINISTFSNKETKTISKKVLYLDQDLSSL